MVSKKVSAPGGQEQAEEKGKNPSPEDIMAKAKDGAVNDFNPYKILGVKVDASPDQIKAAWRKLVSKHHPDKGGDRDEYEKVIRANDILSDATARDRYDRTGTSESTNPDNMRAAAVNFIVEYFKSCMEQVIDNNGDPCTIDLVGLALKYMKQNVLTLREQQQRPRKLVDALERSIKRLTKKRKLEEGSILHDCLGNQVVNYYRIIEGYEEQIDLMNVALGIMMDYEFKAETFVRLSGGLVNNPNFFYTGN